MNDQRRPGAYDPRYNALTTRRWLPVYNGTQDTIPPFGVMRIVSIWNREGSDIFVVSKPNDETVLNPHNASMLINGPFPIGGQRFGDATIDWPCQVLCLGQSGTVGQWLKPVSGQWYMTGSNDGNGFIGMGVSSAPSPVTGTQVAWVGERSFVGQAAASEFYAAGEAAVANAVEFSGTSSSGSWGQGVIEARTDGKIGFELSTVGLYQFSFSAMISSPDGVSGDIIGFGIKVGGTSNIYGTRVLTIADDGDYGGGEVRTEENVAATGVIGVSGTSLTPVTCGVEAYSPMGCDVSWSHAMFTVVLLSTLYDI